MVLRITLIASLVLLGAAVLQVVFLLLRWKLLVRKRDLHVSIETPGQEKREVVVAPHDVKSIEKLISEVSVLTKGPNDDKPAKR